MTVAAPTDKRRPFDPATRKPRGKSQHIIAEAKGHDADVKTWRKAFRSANIPDGPKALGFTMSTYGNTDGSKVHPGNERLASDHHCNELTIRRHIKVLVKTGWMRKAREYKAGVNREYSDEYQLTIPDPSIQDEVLPSVPGLDGWHLREPEDDLEVWESDLYTDPDDQCTNLIEPVDKVVRPPSYVPSNRERSSRAVGTTAPGRDRPRGDAHAPTAKRSAESQETPQAERVPKQRKTSNVPEENRTERDGYIALIPHLSVDEVQEVLNELWDVRAGVWKWAHDKMRKDYKEPTSKETGHYYEPETPEKARAMYVNAFLCTSASGVWHKCLTDPLDAVDDA
jgi:hypothetical protein